jgi:hypothetical protein
VRSRRQRSLQLEIINMHKNEALPELRARIREKPCDPVKISALLDAVTPADRPAVVRALGRADQRRLWRAVDGFRPLRLTDLVPPSIPALTPVRHYGRNSMPAFTLFEKRFFRPPGADPSAPRELYGANFQFISPLTGPGYFVAVEDPQRPEVLIDYRRIPTVAPEGWPSIVGNDRGRSFIFYGMMLDTDTLRRVSEHVAIGSLSRKGRSADAYFVLCRQEPLP